MEEGCCLGRLEIVHRWNSEGILETTREEGSGNNIQRGRMEESLIEGSREDL